MSRDSAFLLDILEAAKLALGYVSGKTREQFYQETQCQDAVIRRLEIIGEAARRLSPETRQTLPDLPWNSMIGIRNVMIHEYDDVDLTIVRDTVERDLPLLIQAIEIIVPPETSS